MVSAYDELPRTPANFVALSPLRYLERAAYIYPNQASIIHGKRQISWKETYQRCCQFASQLKQLGIEKMIRCRSYYQIFLPWLKHISQFQWLVPYLIHSILA